VPALSEKIRELFGIDFSGLLAELGEPKQISRKTLKQKTPHQRATVKGNKTQRGRKRPSRTS
jgi:hypothetical protein